MRRYLAVGLDSYLCLLAVGLLVRSCLDSGGTGHAVALLVVQLAALSFANQVLLTMAVRASAGKLIMGVRVIRLPDAGPTGIPFAGAALAVRAPLAAAPAVAPVPRPGGGRWPGEGPGPPLRGARGPRGGAPGPEQ